MLGNKGIIRNNVNKFAAAYRMIDLLVIQLGLAVAVASHGISYDKNYFELSLVASLSFLVTAESFALYRSWRAGFFKEIVFYTLISWAVASIFILIYLFFTKTSAEYSRIAFTLWFGSTFTMLIGWRYGFTKLLECARLSGYNTRSVAILGLTPGGVRLAQHIFDHPETGYRIRGIYDDRVKDRLDPAFHGWLRGSIKDGVDKARENKFDLVYVALPFKAEERIQEVLHLLGDTTANVQLVPDFFAYSLMNASMSRVGDIQTISVFANPMQGASAVLKRFEDLVLATTILAIIAIPMALIALGIKLTSPGPVIFKQDRYGLDGRKIRVWKFRSMTVTENSGAIKQATRNDARVTPFGAFLRKTSLDELPQFFNVLQGDMSVVGPRPHAVAHNEEYRKQVGFYMLRHKVKPGITGWAQINGWRGETDTVDKMGMRVEYDLDYIRNWSLWMDFKIVIFTILRSFNDTQAY